MPSAVRYATEPLTDQLWDELLPLLVEHYREIAHWHDIPLEPNRAAYEQINAAGMLRAFTARDESGALIGYLCVLVSRSLHYASQIFANQDVLYVAKQHRGTGAGVGLIAYAHRELRERDRVNVILQHTKHRADINIGPMLIRRFGYEHVDDVLACRLDRAP